MLRDRVGAIRPCLIFLTLFVIGFLPKSVNFAGKKCILAFGQTELWRSQLIEYRAFTVSHVNCQSNGTAVVISGDCLGKVEDFK